MYHKDDAENRVLFGIDLVRLGVVLNFEFSLWFDALNLTAKFVFRLPQQSTI